MANNFLQNKKLIIQRGPIVNNHTNTCGNANNFLQNKKFIIQRGPIVNNDTQVRLIPQLPQRTKSTGLTSHSVNMEGCESWSDTSENTKLWTDASTEYIINLCKAYDKEFSSGIKKYVWDKIAKELSEKFGQLYTAQQCDTKWKGLKSTYKSVKKHNDQSGNSYRFWKFYESMNQILFCKPEINSVATCSSARGLVVKVSDSEANMGNENLNEDPNNSIINTPKNYTSSFMRKRKYRERSVERRHKEKMARQDTFLEIFGRLTSAIESSVAKKDAGN